MPKRFDFEENHWADQTFSASTSPRDATPAEGFWVRSPRPHVDPTATMRVPAIAVTFVTFIVSVSLAVQGRIAFAGTLVAIGIVVNFLILILVWAERKALVAVPEDLRILEDSKDADVCLVQITIVAYGSRVGIDRGVAWYEDNRLLFSGHATSFALGGQDVLPRSLWGDFPRWSRGVALPYQAIPLALPTGHAYVLFETLHGQGPAEEARSFRFLKALSEFRSHALDSEAPRQWPPLESPKDVGTKAIQ